MKVLKNTLAVAAAFAMVGAPVVASAANPASKLSVSQSVNKSARAGVAVRKDGSDIRGGSTIVALGAAALVILGIVLAAGGSNSPSSP